MHERRFPQWASAAAIGVSLALAWLNFLSTTRWSHIPGSLHGWRQPWYAAALAAATILAVAGWRRLGLPARLGRLTPVLLLLVGTSSLIAAFVARLPPARWAQVPFKDDWTELFQQAVNGVRLLEHGSVVGWNWWFQGGYPTSTDIAQNLAAVGFLPMVLAGDRVGYHLLHAIVFLALPAIVWWDLHHEDRDTGLVAGGFAALFVAGYLGILGDSGDTNSLIGVFCAAIALAGSRGARLGRRWGGPVMLAGLTLALYTHAAFAVYASIFLAFEAVYFRDRVAFLRLVVAVVVAGAASLPVHWESLRYPAYVSFNNTVYNPGATTDWALAARSLYYNVEILALPNRWFNDYRSLANVWLPALVVLALRSPRSRVGFYAWATVLTQALLRLDVQEQAGEVFDRIFHMLPVIAAPAFAGLVSGFAGTRRLATALMVVIGLYVGYSWTAVPHVDDLRDFNPELMDRIASADGNTVLVEVSPHRDMDSDPVRRSVKTPFDVHFEGLLPGVAGQRFYSQMIDGWVWNKWRGQVVGAGTFAGRAIGETPPEVFTAEMRRWGVRHLFVWTDPTRSYLAASGSFSERWRSGVWSHFEMADADVRPVVTASGSGELRNLSFLGGEVWLTGAVAGETVVVRTNYYPAWQAAAGGEEVSLFDVGGQLAFRAPRSGTYAVNLAYPRYRWLSFLSMAAFGAGIVALHRLGGVPVGARRALATLPDPTSGEPSA